MTIYINEEDKKLFEQNGFNQQSVGDTVNHYRSQGLSDDDIQAKINQRLEGWRTPKQNVKTNYTYPNQDINGISPEDFKKNIDSIYNIPQVPMPARNNAGYTDSDGNVRESLPTFAENHPVINSAVEGIKQLPQNAYNAISNIGNITQNIQPQYQMNGDTPLLTGGVSVTEKATKALGAVNNLKNKYINQPLTNVGRNITRPLLPKGLENRFLGSQEDEALLKKFEGVEFPSYEELLNQYKNGGMTQDVYLQTLKDKLAVENARLDKNYRDWRNPEWGKTGLLLALSALPMLAGGAAAGAGATTAGVAANASNLAKVANILGNTAKTGLIEGAKFGGVYGLGSSIIDKNSNPITQPLEDAALFGVTNAILNPVITTALAAGRAGAPYIKSGIKEGINRLNPKNYTQEIVAEPVQRGMGMSQRTVYEPKVKRVYKPEQNSGYNAKDINPKQITDNGTGFTMGEGSELNIIAPKTMEKKTVQDLPVVYNPPTQVVTEPIVNAVKEEYKPKRYKYENGKTVEVMEDGSYKDLPNKYSNIAPNIVADKAEQEEQKALRKKCYEILAQASGKKESYIKMTLNSNPKTLTGKKKAEKLREALLQSADTIDQSTIAGFEGYFGDISEGNSSIVERALQILDGKYEAPVSKIVSQYNEMGAEIESMLQNARKKIQEAGEKGYDVAGEEIENIHNNFPKEDLQNDFNELYQLADDTVNKSLYNGNKGVVNNERERNIYENNGRNGGKISEYDTGNESGSDGTTPSKDRNDLSQESGSQVAIEGLEEESAKSVQKQQDEVTAKENKEKYSTTQGGKQNQMFNTEQFKNGQQMLFDTSDMPKEQEVKKSSYIMKSGKEKEFEYVEEIPEGYSKLEGASTAPLGYTWYTNGKSLLNGERKNILVKDKAAEENSVVEKTEETVQDKIKNYENKIPKNYRRDEKTKALWLYKNNYITRSEFESVQNSEPVKSEPKMEAKKKETNKLEDSGEFLKGNRKQDTSLTWDDLKEMNDLVRAKNTTKARVYPKPSIEDLKSEGFSEFQAGIIQNVYNKINAKPAAGYDSIDHQKQYVDTINEVMGKVKDYIKSHSDEFTTDLIAEAAKKYRSWSYDYNKSLFDAVFPDTENKKAANRYSSIFRLYPEYNRKALVVGGNKFTGALQLDNKTLVDVMKAIEDSKKVKETGGKVKTEPWEKTFIILEPDKWNKVYAVANKKNKQVLAKYATKEEAVAAAQRVHEKIEKMKAESKKENFVRNHIERRENNKNVTTEELQNAFGFRGVNFGNWANAKERQDFTNFAYDSLYDLAELLNLPPKALSLNGQLGLAYGAQGKGGFGRVGAAHYIPEYKEINLTKEHGAGSLAHEWWHALDNYFGNQATKKEYSREWALSLSKGGELRPELFETLENLQKQIKQSPFTEEDIKKRAEQLTIQTKARIKRYADSIKQDYAKSQNSAELNKIVDDLVENQEKYKTLSFEDLFEIENKFFKLVPSKRDTLTNRGKFSWLTGEIRRLNDIEELARKGAKKSEYLENAEKIDGQGGGKYWSEDTELGARAFAAYIFDKMKNQNIENRFLTRSGDGAVLNLNFFKELAEGEERESLTLSTIPKGDERARIFKAFDKLFDTIKTRETEKGVELYNEEFNPVKPITDLISNVNKYFETKEAFKNGSNFEDLSNNNEIFNAIRKELENRTDYNGNTLFEHIKDYTFTDMVKADKTTNRYGLHVGKDKAIYINTDAIEALPQNEQTGRFINTVRHEIEHAIQEKQHNDIVETRGLKDSELKIFDSLAKELVKEKPSSKIISTLNNMVNKIANKRNLRNYEVDALKDYAELKVVNKQKSEYYNNHKDVLAKWAEKTIGKTKTEARKVYNKLKPSQKIIVDNYTRLFNNYYNAKYEANARKTGEAKAKEVINANNGRTALQLPRLSKQRNVRTRPQGGTPSEEFGETSEEFEGFGETKVAVNKNTSDEINQVVRDKVYDWHGKLESDRYDVDKALNSFIQLTKHKAKSLSQKTGVKISDKQLREILPFLRERTGFPKTLDRDDLRNIFNKLSGSDKAELAKLADSVSDKFEKYYTNYKDAKGEQTEESIENHISHIWDLDDKKKSLLTNYITTNSKFAKKRTIGTFVEGIDGIEINGEKVQFKPKTLDYAEILKSSSDNLIKATHDSILANEIKNLKYKGEPMVLSASKAPSEWIEVNHPALNKAVYMGSVGEDELPMLMKTPVKVHPEIADYVNAIFEVQKPSKFWNTFDSLNGMIKQALLGFSGFHGYALSESSIGNAGVGKTLKELNPKKFVDAIKNGNYDVYKNEEAAKRAINAGVQLGTPSDLQRNLVEDTLKKIPLVGKYVAGAVSANNKILWDVLHNNFKILAFNTAIENLGGNVSKEQERAIAQWVNDSFGGQAWELLGIKKSSVKAASRVLLSPDWNFSTIRQAAAAINSEWADDLINQNKTGKRIAQVIGAGGETGSKGARGKIGRGFWLRSALFFTVFYNLMNAAFREKDRKEHPNLYPDEMTPKDYSIWSNSYPMDNIYDRIMPKVFIGRNKDGTSRMLRVGKQFREVPEFLTEPVTKLGGKTSPIINTASQVGLGMGAGDVVKKITGGEAYLNQDIWDGYGENAEKKEGAELALGRAKALGKSLTPFIGSKYISDKHEPSAWDFFAQTNAGGSKSKVFKQVKEALKAGKPEVIEDIERMAYQDGVPYKDIEAMIKDAQEDYKAENTKRYKNKLVNSYKNEDEKEYERIREKMTKKHLSEEEQRRIRDKAWEEYQKSNQS